MCFPKVWLLTWPALCFSGALKNFNACVMVELLARLNSVDRSFSFILILSKVLRSNACVLHLIIFFSRPLLSLLSKVFEPGSK